MPNEKIIGILRWFENAVYFVCSLKQRMSYKLGNLTLRLHNIMQLRNNLAGLYFIINLPRAKMKFSSRIRDSVA